VPAVPQKFFIGRPGKHNATFASEVTTVGCYRNFIIIIIVIVGKFGCHTNVERMFLRFLCYIFGCTSAVFGPTLNVIQRTMRDLVKVSQNSLYQSAPLVLVTHFSSF